MVGRFPICTYRSVWPERVKWLTAFFALCLLPALAGAQVHFADVTASAGIDFHHLHGGTGAKYPMETVGSGAVLFDYDGDGWLDLYFVNSAGPGVLYRNSADGTFSDVSDASGARLNGWYWGSAFLDFDNDGLLDIYAVNGWLTGELEHDL